MGLPTKSIDIANGASLSSALDVGGGRLIGVIFPAALTGVALGIQVSFDNGVTYYPLCDSNGTLVIVPFVASSVISGFDYAVAAANYIKFQSLTATNVAQAEGAARTIGVITR